MLSACICGGVTGLLILGAGSPFNLDAPFPCPARGAPMGIDENPPASVVTTAAAGGGDGTRGRDGRTPALRLGAAACRASVVIITIERCWLMAWGFDPLLSREGICEEAAASIGVGSDAAPDPWKAAATSRPPAKASAQSAAVLPSTIILAGGLCALRVAACRAPCVSRRIWGGISEDHHDPSGPRET